MEQQERRKMRGLKFGTLGISLDKEACVVKDCQSLIVQPKESGEQMVSKWIRNHLLSPSLETEVEVDTLKKEVSVFKVRSREIPGLECMNGTGKFMPSKTREIVRKARMSSGLIEAIRSHNEGLLQLNLEA